MSFNSAASASAYSWFGPPRPLPRTVTVSSPPDRIATPCGLGAGFQREFCVIGGDIAGLAFEIGAEIDHLVSGGRSRDLDRGVERAARPSDQREAGTGERGVAGLAAFIGAIVERAGDGIVDREAISCDQRARSASVVGSGTVGPEAIALASSRGTSDIASVTISARCAGPRQSAALDPRQMLSHRVDLADRRAGAEQRPRHLLLLGERRHRPARSSSPSRRPTAAPAADRRRSPPAASFKLSSAPSARFVGNGMAGLDHLDPPRRHAMAMARRGDAGQARGSSPRRRGNAAPRRRPWRRRPCRRRGK